MMMAHRANPLDLSQRTIFTVTFWADAVERAISTAAATAVSVLTVGNTVPHLINAPWLAAAALAGGAAALDVLRSLAAAGRGNPGTASMLHATRADVPPPFVARFTGGR